MLSSRWPKAPARSCSGIRARTRIRPVTSSSKTSACFSANESKLTFEETNIPIVMRYFDPSYLIRSSPANAADAILCDLYARNAVHAAMAGKTGLVIGYLHDAFIHIPIEMLVLEKKKQINPDGFWWKAVL